MPARYSAAASNSGALMLGAEDMLPPLLLATAIEAVARRAASEAARRA